MSSVGEEERLGKAGMAALKNMFGTASPAAGSSTALDSKKREPSPHKPAVSKATALSSPKSGKFTNDHAFVFVRAFINHQRTKFL
jgi:hypothetical protein